MSFEELLIFRIIPVAAYLFIGVLTGAAIEEMSNLTDGQIWWLSVVWPITCSLFIIFVSMKLAIEGIVDTVKSVKHLTNGDG